MRRILCTLLCYGIVAVWAQVNVLLDITAQNDFLNYRGHGTDRYYTGGNQLGFLLQDPTKKISSHYFSVSQQVFTPSDLQDTALRSWDYPYGGLLFFSYQLQHDASSLKTKWALSSSWGFSGRRSGAHRTQQVLHRIIGDEIPRGWDHITENGFFMQFALLVGQPVISAPPTEVTVFQVAEWGHLFQRIRWGVQFLRGTYHAPRGSFLFFPTATHPTKTRSLSFFLTPTLSWVIRNQLLQWYPADRSIAGRILRQRLAGLEFGLGIRFRQTCLQFTQYLQQPEFEQAHSHAYGEISLLLPLVQSNQ